MAALPPLLTSLADPSVRTMGALAGAALFGALAWRARLLTAGGALVAGGLAATLLWRGTAYHAATGIGFFALASALSKLPGGRAAAAEAEKGSQRDALQVLANGGVAWACLLLWPHQPVLWAGALAAAAADTWATEIGTRYGGTPRHVLTLRRVPAGTSGAVSGAGTLGALLGAVSVAGLGALVAPGAPLLAPVLGGLAGAFADTLLGATLQVRYRTAAGLLTERPAASDGTPHAHARGLRWINNDAVNALATLVGSLVAGLVGAFL